MERDLGRQTSILNFLGCCGLVRRETGGLLISSTVKCLPANLYSREAMGKMSAGRRVVPDRLTARRSLTVLMY